MPSALPLFFLTGFAAEVASIIIGAKVVGFFPVLILLAAGIVSGASLIRSAGVNVLEALRAPVQTAAMERHLAAHAISRIAAGTLLIIPGFLSDIMALLLLLPKVEGWIKSQLRSRMPAPHRSFGTVIEGEAVEVNQQRASSASGRQPL